MKLMIDTQQDSPEQIRKAIRMLQSLVGDTPSELKSAPAEASPELFSLFSDAPSANPAPISTEKPSAAQLLDDVKEPKIELY